MPMLFRRLSELKLSPYLGRTGTRSTRPIERESIVIAALEVTLLIARNEPRRHPRVAARWLLRYLDQAVRSADPIFPWALG